MTQHKFDLELFCQLNEEYASKPLVPRSRKFDSASRKKEGSARVQGLKKIYREATGRQLKGKRVLEIGCGRGNTTFEVATQLDCEVVGVDIVNRASWAEYSAQNPNVSYHQLDISTEDYRALGQFDFIYSYAVWEHMLHPYAALEAVSKLLKPGGLLKPAGHIYLSANLYRGPKASHRYREVHFPWPHLLFEDAVFEEFYQSQGLPSKAAAWVNKLVSAEYLLYFEQLGFRQKKIWYSEKELDRDFYQRFHDRLGRYPEFDLQRDFIHAVLTLK